MADVQLEHGFTRIANDYLEALARAEIGGGQLRILLAVLRQTWGYPEDYGHGRRIASGELAAWTGIDAANCRRLVRELVACGLLQRIDGAGSRAGFLRLQKDFERWRIPGRRQSGGICRVINDLPAGNSPREGVDDPESHTSDLKETPKTGGDSRVVDDPANPPSSPRPPPPALLLKWWKQRYQETRGARYLTEPGDPKRLAELFETHERQGFIEIVNVFLTDQRYADDFVREKGWTVFALKYRAQRIAADRGARKQGERQRQARAVELERQRALEDPHVHDLVERLSDRGHGGDQQ